MVLYIMCDPNAPECITKGCHRKAKWTTKNHNTGKLYYGKLCNPCSNVKYKMGNGAHRYAVKDYCENVDGRLGFTCPTDITGMMDIFPKLLVISALDVDHIDGDHKNNKESNLQTLCKTCHYFKTQLNKDWKKGDDEWEQPQDLAKENSRVKLLGLARQESRV